MRRSSYRRDPGIGTFIGIGIFTVVLNLLFVAAVIAVIVLVLRALGVIS